jgi:hypothetical protein
MPGFPGAQNSSVTLLDPASFQARACSRPPLPMIKTVMKKAPLKKSMSGAGTIAK